MASTYNQYAAAGGNRNFAVPFAFIDRSYVHVYVDGVETAAFTWINDGMVQLTSAPANGALVEVRRVTPTGVMPVDFEDGSILSEDQLDIVAKFSAHLSEEARDYAADSARLNASNDGFDIRGKRLRNVAAAVDPSDAPNKAQLDALLPAVQASEANALASRNAAAASAGAAAGSEASALSYLRAYRATSYGALYGDPTLDPNGDPPTPGDEYFDLSSTPPLLKRFNGGTWQASDISTANLAASGGSSLSGHTQGDSGAVALTVQKKLRQKLSVMDYIDPSMWAAIESGNVAGQNATLITTGIQAAITTALTRRKRLEATGGLYLHNALVVNGALEIEGEGRGATEFRGIPLNATLWGINSNVGVVFSALTLSGNNASTSGAVILVDNAGDVNYDTILDNITLKECFDGFHPRKAGRFSVRNCYFVDCYGAAVTVENQINGDNGDSNISGSVFANPAGAGKGILHLSSGGLRIVNNKGLGFKKFYHGFPGTGVLTSDLIVTGNSVEGYTEGGVYLESNGGQLGNVIVAGNQFAVIGAGCIGVYVDDMQNIGVSSNVFRMGSSTEIGVRLGATQQWYVGSNVFQGNGGATIGTQIDAGAGAGVIGPQHYAGIGTKVVNNGPASAVDRSQLGALSQQAVSDVKLTGTTDKTVGSQLLQLSSSDPVSPLQMLAGYQPGYTYIQSLEQGVGFRPLMLNRSGGNIVLGSAAEDGTNAKLQVNGPISTNPVTTTTAPAAGAADALPANPAGYKTEYINGVARKIPYY